jgi:dTDP-L-rhamnose 4-epimerase
VVTVAKTLVQNYGLDTSLTITGNYRLGDIRHNYADLKKINAKLGFSPKVDFEEGIKRFTNWVNTQEIKEDQYGKSIAELKQKGMYK